MKIHNFAIIGIVTALLISLTSLCSAYTLPDENRWIKIVDSEQYDNWFDLETVKTYRANSFFCKNHRYFESWFFIGNNLTGRSMKRLSRYDLDCMTEQILITHIYDEQGNLLGTVDEIQPIQHIVPNSNSEYVIKTLQIYYGLLSQYHQAEKI